MLSASSSMAVASIVMLAVVATAKTLLTKLMFEKDFGGYDFDYPVVISLLSAVGTLGCTVGLFMSGVSKFRPFPHDPEQRFPFCVAIGLTAVGMALTNISLSMISVALNQTIKSATPVLVVLLEYVVQNKTHTPWVYPTLVLLTAGPMITSYGQGATEFNASLMGMLCMIGATAASAGKNVYLHSSISKLKKQMGMVCILFWMELGISCFLFPWALLHEVWHISEWQYVSSPVAWIVVIFIALGGGLRAYAQNLVLRFNSALTLVCTQVCILAITILLSIPIFQTKTSGTFFIGVCTSIVGYGLYSTAKHHEKKVKSSVGIVQETSHLVPDRQQYHRVDAV